MYEKKGEAGSSDVASHECTRKRARPPSPDEIKSAPRDMRPEVLKLVFRTVCSTAGRGRTFWHILSIRLISAFPLLFPTPWWPEGGHVNDIYVWTRRREYGTDVFLSEGDLKIRGRPIPSLRQGDYDPYRICIRSKAAESKPKFPFVPLAERVSSRPSSQVRDHDSGYRDSHAGGGSGGQLDEAS